MCLGFGIISAASLTLALSHAWCMLTGFIIHRQQMTVIWKHSSRER